MACQDLINRLRLSGYGDLPPAGVCPDDHEIAGFVDGILDAPIRARLEDHLADCHRCARLIGVLLAVQTEAPVPVPDPLVARAKRAPAGRHSYWPALAAAATIVLAVTMLVQVGIDRPPPNDQAVRTTRGSPTQVEIHITAPSSGAAVGADELVFRWNEVSRARYYVVRVVTASGDLVSEHRVTSTEWRPGNSLALVPGEDYFVRVDAYPAVGPSSSSIHVPFSIRGPP